MASGPWDNIQLPGPPNGPAWAQAAAQLMGATGNAVNGAFNAYNQQQQFGNQQQLFPFQLAQAQRQQNLGSLFQNGVPTLPNGNVDYNSVFKSMLQAGGAPEVGTALSALPAMQKQQLIDQYLGQGGQQPPPSQPTHATAVYGITGTNTGNTAPRIPTRQTADEGEETTLNTLAAQYHVDPGAFLKAYPGFKSLANADLTDDQIRTVQSRMSKFKQTVRDENPVENPVSQSGNGDQEGNHITPSGIGGTSAMSPRQTGERRVQQTAQAPQPAAPTPTGATVPPQFRDNPQTFADYLRARATQLRQSPKGKVGDLLGVSSKRDEDEAKALDDRASKVEEQLAKDVTAKRTPQIEADTKYYDSLHRGLSGTAMIAAQQKQNIDMLRQIAKSPGFTPGAGSELALAYQRTIAQLDIDPTAAAPREIFNQVATRILADQISGLKSMASETGEQGARVFKSMIDLEEKANITHENSLEGIKSQLDIIDRVGDLMLKWADKADDYKIKNGALDAGFDKSLRADISKARLPNIVPQKPAGATSQPKRQPGGWQEIAPGIRIREKPNAANQT